MIIYTYSSLLDPPENRWAFNGVGDNFYGSLEDARQAVVEIREDYLSHREEDDGDWTPINIERVEIVPITEKNVLVLLNEGIEPFILSYEVVDVID